MPLVGSGDQLNLLINRLRALPDFTEEIAGEAVPTVQILLSHATTSSAVPPRFTRLAARAYNIDEEMQERIDSNTHVEATRKWSGLGRVVIHVGLSGGNLHLRPVVPIGELPLKWRGAISAKIKGAIRRQLKANGKWVVVSRTPPGASVGAKLQNKLKKAGV